MKISTWKSFRRFNILPLVHRWRYFFCTAQNSIARLFYIGFSLNRILFVRKEHNYLTTAPIFTFSPWLKWLSIAFMSDLSLSIWDSTRAFSRCSSVISASRVMRSSPPPGFSIPEKNEMMQCWSNDCEINTSIHICSVVHGWKS